MTFSKIALSMTALSIVGTVVKFSNVLNGSPEWRFVVVFCKYFYNECCYGKRHFAECHGKTAGTTD
jgi:hypothetical protein